MLTCTAHAALVEPGDSCEHSKSSTFQICNIGVEKSVRQPASPLSVVYFIKSDSPPPLANCPAGFAAFLWMAARELTEGRGQPTARLPTASDNDLGGTNQPIGQFH